MYSEPEWSQAISQTGIIEVMKDGKIISSIPLVAGTKFMTIGRLPENDISLEHQSISRKHAIIQFGPRNTAFMYDLGSSHGTFVNKKQIPPFQFVKINSRNAVFNFGASSRLFVLLLDDLINEEVPESNDTDSSRIAVTEFFEAHSIPVKSITFGRSDELITCICNFSEYISIDSSESSQISSSGATKDEALSNFYEDSFNFLYRLDFIDVKQKNGHDSEDSVSEHDFYDQLDTTPKIDKSSNDALSEEQIITLRDKFEVDVERIQLNIDELKFKIAELDNHIVDDLDVYVQDLKKTELENDIEKCNKNLEVAKKELLKYESILRLISSNNCSESNVNKYKHPVVFKRSETILDKHSAEEFPENHKKVKETDDVLREEENASYESEAEAVDFEDSPGQDELLDFNSVKIKYGY